MFERNRSTGAGSASGDATRRASHVGATSLIKDGVYDKAGERLGEVEELILDTRTGCVRYVVLSCGGFLGIGGRRFAIPWSAVTPDNEYRRCVVDVAQMNLTAVPVSDDDLWLQRTPPTRGHDNPFARAPHALPAHASNAGPWNRLPVASPE